LPEAELDNLCSFLENFKTKHPLFAVEVFTNNLESSYVEIFSKSPLKIAEKIVKNSMMNNEEQKLSFVLSFSQINKTTFQYTSLNIRG